MHADREAEKRIEAQFPGWRVWRGKNRKGEPVSWCASRTDDNKGIYPTLVCNSEETLVAELADQRKRADRGDPRPEDHIATIPLTRPEDTRPAFV